MTGSETKKERLYPKFYLKYGMNIKHPLVPDHGVNIKVNDSIS